MIKWLNMSLDMCFICGVGYNILLRRKTGRLSYRTHTRRKATPWFSLKRLVHLDKNSLLLCFLLFVVDLKIAIAILVQIWQLPQIREHGIVNYRARRRIAGYKILKQSRRFIHILGQRHEHAIHLF